MIAPGHEETGWEMRAVAAEDLADVGELSERDLVPNTRYDIENHTD